MLRYAIVFFCLGLLAMVLGLNQIAGVSLEIGKLLLFIFLGLALLSFLASFATGRRRGPQP